MKGLLYVLLFRRMSRYDFEEHTLRMWLMAPWPGHTATVWLVGWELARQEHIKLRALFLARDSQYKDSRVFPDSCKHVKSETVFELGVAICGIPIKWQFFPPCEGR